MPFTVGLSQHADPGMATGEIVGRVLESLGAQPDVALLFTSGDHLAHTDEIAAAVVELLNPGAFVGTTASSVAAGEREIEEETAAVLWAGSLGSIEGPRARAVRLDGVPGPADDDDALAAAFEEVQASGELSMILLADPYSYPADAALAHWAERWPQVGVLGGLSSGAPMPGGNRIVVDGGVHRSGAAALVLGGSASVTHLVSQGCRPIGQPYIITEAEGNVVRSLGGMPPFERLEQMFSQLDPADQQLVQRGLHVGRVTDERKIEFERGDFLIRGVLGADRESGAIAIGDEAPVGATVQFHVRDALTAHEDLTAALRNRAPEAMSASGALLFTCNGRGTHLFETPHHDAHMIVERTSTELAGMFCAGEIGPVGNRSYLHGFTASMALFTDNEEPDSDV
ncbi:FIST signal transduction protein [Candidatus Poriferisodalis sp.]|uniref:FIST signal transduction protein n=1 Tax=Candidatus Poriferisodalis sp. TaxID=3101277 RepID=UPI003B02B276